MRNEQSTSQQRILTPTTLPKQSPTPLSVSVSQAKLRFTRCSSRRTGRQGTTGWCCFLLTPPQEPAWPPPPCWVGKQSSAGPPSRPRTPRRAPAPEGAPSRQRDASSGERARAGSRNPRPARGRPRRERRGGAGGERRREGGRGVRAPGNSLLLK